MALSATAVAAFLGRTTDEIAAVLLTLSHATLSPPIRVTDNGANITSGGDVFQTFPFEIQLPTDGESVPKAKLRIANIDRSIGQALDDIKTPIVVKIEIVLVSSPSTIEKSWDQFELVNVTIDALAVEGDLVVRSRSSEPWPNVMVTPGRFPALFEAAK